MSDPVSPKQGVRGRPFVKGRSGNPLGRQCGSRNKVTLAAAALLDGESEALTRKAVEVALAGDPTALRLCLDRLLPPVRERAITFRLPPPATLRNGEAREPLPGDVAAVMNAVMAALAGGEITPGEAERIAGVFGTFIAAIDRTQKDSYRFNLLRILTEDAARPVAGGDESEEGDDSEEDGDDDEDDGEPDDYDA
jgi:hypothetical protein